MEMMNAIVQHAPFDFRLERVPKPSAGPLEVVLRVEAAGICAGDRTMYQGKAPWGINPGEIPGHEYVGVVEELGEGAGELYGLAPGERCTAEVQIPCLGCGACRKGWFHLCEGVSGFQGGGWAEYMLLRRGAVIHKVPKSIHKLDAAMIEPLSCGAYAVERAGVEMKDTVAVAGMGAIGLAALQFARLRNPYCLIALGTSDENTSLAKEFGADEAIDVRQEDAAARIRELTGGAGCDVYIECSGSPASAETGMAALGRRGRLMVYGVYTKTAAVDLNEIGQNKELTILGGHLSPGMMPYVIRCLETGRIHPRKMATDIFPLEAFGAAINIRKARPGSIKTILVPGWDGKEEL